MVALVRVSYFDTPIVDKRNTLALFS